MVEGVVSTTAGMLGNLLKEEVKFLSGVRDEVQELHVKLQELQCFLKDADKRQHESETVRNLIRSIRKLAYEVGNLLETYAVQVESRKGKGIKKALKRFACLLDEGVKLHRLGLEVGKIKNEISKLTTSLQSYGIVKLENEGQSSNAASKTLQRQTFAHEIEEHFVGMQSDVSILVSLISGRDKDHRIISIYGMGGSGKTTLAKQIFNHRDVQTRFASFAWVTVSQQYNAESLLQDILRQLNPIRKKDDIQKMEYRELVEELCKAQTEKKCLVVLDDLWKREDWTILSHAFPAAVGCTVLLTTRIQGVAEIVISHKLNLFSDEEGWQLLKKKASTSANDGDSSVQAKKEKLGQQMVRNCGYLPLAISVIGGILSKKVALEEWEMVNRDINSYLKYGEGMEENYQVNQILSLSYDNLPYHLKPCFLYLAYYPEDSEINVDTLCLMWIAEGMVLSNDQRRNETLLEVAERYLIELANRSLVQVQLSDELDVSLMISKIASCRLHDLIRDLCLRKCKEDDFLEVMDFQGEQPHTSLGGNAYRLAIYGEMDENVGDKILQEANKSTRLYSLRYSKGLPIAHKVRKDLGKLRFLNVVIFKGLKFVNTKLLHKVIKKLILLKFLSFDACELDEMPSSIGTLRYLQTFWLINCYRVKIPNVFWKLERLMHFCLDDRMGGGVKLRVDGLTMLETLICNTDEYSIEVQGLPALTNLRVCALQVKDNESLSSIIGCIEVNWCNIQSLGLQIYPNCNFNTTNGSTLLYKLFKCRALKDLRIWVPMRELPQYESGMLSGLVHLRLEDCFVVEDPMPTLEKLPELASLLLMHDSFVGEELICSSIGFPNLKNIWLDSLPNLKKWRIDEGAMPNLSRVSIWMCSKELVTSYMPREFNNRIRVVNGEEGADFHKVRHVPLISLYDA